MGNDVCVEDGGDVTQKKEIVNYCEPPLNGRYVHVMLKGKNRTLTLCEIEVYEAKGGYYFSTFKGSL